MPFLILSLIVQAALIAHIVRTGRNQMWIMAVAFLPVAGALAYLVLEVLPGMRHQRHVRHIHAKAAHAIDPERDIRAARDQLSIADTAGSRIRLADALAAAERPKEAVPLYEEALARAVGDDPTTQAKLARAALDAGDPARALAVADGMKAAGSQAAADRINQVRAEALAATGRREEAATLWDDLVTRLPGDEGRCRYAALLIEMGRRAEAQAVLEEVGRRAKRLDRLSRLQQADMYGWAERTLAELKA